MPSGSGLRGWTMASGKIATAYVQILPSMSGVAPKVKSYFGGAGNEAGGLFGGNLVGKIKSALVASGIGAALKQSVMEGADLEQSLGGIETLFKDSAATVIANAEQAYKTAGMSANSYMENVTSFSASLLQSLGGDTAKATGVANMALTDMSDNANKMGTEMERITDAYQGFAKGNYTMLDNLKLGYGGTKTEMERLLKDARALTGVKYDINNLSDVYEAIHAVQEELGITGTTAKEASSTLTGSFNAMKAAFSDVLGNLALGRDLAPSLNALSETTVTYLSGNLIPAIKNILTALPGTLSTFISDALPSDMTGVAVLIIDKLAIGLTSSVPKLLNTALPIVTEFTGSIREKAGMLVDSGLNLIMNVGQGIITAIPSIIENVPQIITNICGLINDNAPKLLTTGVKLIVELGKGVIQAGPTLLENIPKILESIMAAFSAANWVSVGSKMITAIGNGAKAASPSSVMKTAQELVKSFTEKIRTNLPTLVSNGTQMLINLARGFISGIPNFLSSVGTILQSLLSSIRGILPTLLNNGAQFVSSLLSGLNSMLPNLWTAVAGLLKQLLANFASILPSIVSAGASILANLASGILNNLPLLISSGATIMADFLSIIGERLPDMLTQGISLIGQLVAGLISMIPDVISVGQDIWEDFKATITEINWLQLGIDIIKGIVAGLWDAANSLYKAIRDIIKNALKAGKEEAEVKSPSRLFRRELGRQLPAGAALGVYDGIPLMRKAMNDMMDVTNTEFTSRLRFHTQFASSDLRGNTAADYGRSVVVHQYIYSEAKTAAELMLEARYQAEKAVLFGV